MRQRSRWFQVIARIVIYGVMPTALVFVVSAGCVWGSKQSPRTAASRVWRTGSSGWEDQATHGQPSAFSSGGSPTPRYQRFAEHVDPAWREKYLERDVFTQRQTVAVSGAVGVESEHTVVSNMDDSNRQVAHVGVLRSGWPFLCFEAFSTSCRHDLKTPQRSYRWQHVVHIPKSWQAQSEWQIIPIKPIWAGFAGNVLIYAAAIWMVVDGWRTVRRAWRKRSGRCFGCGYELGGLRDRTRCPECGVKQAGADAGERQIANA
jgi:hypothetical protein